MEGARGRAPAEILYADAATRSCIDAMPDNLPRPVLREYLASHAPAARSCAPEHPDRSTGERAMIAARIAGMLSLALLMTAAAAVRAAGPDPAVLSYKMPADLKWTESATYPGLKSAVLYGDPGRPGPYAVRNRFSPGAFSRPHFH